MPTTALESGPARLVFGHTPFRWLATLTLDGFVVPLSCSEVGDYFPMHREVLMWSGCGLDGRPADYPDGAVGHFRDVLTSTGGLAEVCRRALGLSLVEGALPGDGGMVEYYLSLGRSVLEEHGEVEKVCGLFAEWLVGRGPALSEAFGRMAGGFGFNPSPCLTR